MEEDGNAYVCLDTHTQELEWKKKHIDKKGGQTYEQGQAYNKSTVIRYVLNSQRKKKENIKVVMNTKPNTNHAAIATQVQRQVEKKVYTHDTDS